MRTLGEMVQIIKLQIPNSFESKDILPDFGFLGDYHLINKGVQTFSSFMKLLYQKIQDDESLSGQIKKGKNVHNDEITLTVEFPFLNNIRSMLLNLGQNGKQEEGCLLLSDFDQLNTKQSFNKNSTTKISNSQMRTVLLFLKELGLVFEGLNLEDKRLCVEGVKSIRVSYSGGSNLFIGLIALAKAENELATRTDNYNLMRCNYSILLYEVDLNQKFELATSGFDSEIKIWLSDFKDYLESERMIFSYANRLLGTHFVFGRKKDNYLRFSLSLNRGWRLVIKLKHVSKYQAIFEHFPESLRAQLKAGYLCDRKKVGADKKCRGGCEGYSFPLDSSTIAIGDYLKEIIKHENSY